MAAKIADRVYNGKVEDLDELTGELADIVDPAGLGRRVGAPGASTDACLEIRRLIWGHKAAEAIVTGSPNIENRDLFQVRQMIRDGWIDYCRDWLSLRARASNPDAFEPPDAELQIQRASGVFLVLLGSHLESQAASRPA